MVAFLISRQNISYWTFIQAAGHIFYSFTGAIKRGQDVVERDKKLVNHEPEASNLKLFVHKLTNMLSPKSFVVIF